MSAPAYDSVFIEAWLCELGLSDYIEAFSANHIDEEVLPLLTEEDLRDMGVTSVGHRKRLLLTIRRLTGVAVDGSVAPSPPAKEEGISAKTVSIPPAPAVTEKLSSVEADGVVQPMKLFLSYGRDGYVQEVLALKLALEARGHEVWFDAEQLAGGLDWEQSIEAGLAWCDRVVLTMTPHSVRRPDGYCLNELAKALERQKPIIPVLLSDVPNGAPTSICRIQYLDWRDAVPAAEKPERFAARMARLCEAIEQDKLDFEGGQQRLLRALQPLNYSGDIDRHVARFTGRQPLFGKFRQWLDDPGGAQVLWLCGGSGVGKSAIAAMLAHRWGEAGAVHFCVAGHADKADPRRAILSIAFQLSTKIDAYRTRIAALDLERLVDKDARALFDALLVTPLGGDMPVSPHPWLVVVDALDEANAADGQNSLAELLGQEWRKLPSWLRLAVTAQPEGEVRTWLADAELLNLSADDPDHRADLEFFLRNALSRQGRPVSDDAVRRILERSEGAFQYMVLLLEEIRQGRCDPDDEVALPRGMLAAYLQAFKRRFPDVAGYQSQYQPLVELVLASPDPVPVAVLASACAVTPLEVRRRLAAMGSMLTMQRPEKQNDAGWDTVRLAQSSLRNWLTAVDERTRQPVAGAYTADPQQGLQALAKDVLRRWDESLDMGEEPAAYVSRVLLGVLLNAGLLAEADRVALPLARQWSKRSVSRAWPAALHALQWAERATRKGSPAPPVAKQVAEARLVHAELAAARGESTLALESVRKAQEILEQLLAQAPEDAGVMQALAKCHQQAAVVIRDQGNLSEALVEQQAAVAALERLHQALALDTDATSRFTSSLNVLGNMLRASGDNDAALVAYRRSLALRGDLVRREPTNRAYRKNLGGSHNNIGIVLKQKGDLEGALREYQHFRDIAQALYEDDPQSQEWRDALGTSHHNTSLTFEALGRMGEALEEARSALRVRTGLADDEPENVDYLGSVSVSHGRLGSLLKQQGDLAGALHHARADLAISEALAAKDSANLSRRQAVAEAHGEIAAVLRLQGHTEQAIRELGVALDASSRLVAQNSANAVWKGSLAALESSMAITLRSAGCLEEAVKHSARAVALRESVAERSGANAVRKSSLANALRGHARMLQAAARLGEAVERARASVEIREALVAKDVRNADWQESLAQSLGCLGSILLESGNPADAEPLLLRARDIVAALVAGDPKRADWLDLLSDLHREIGWLRERQGRFEDALDQHREDLKISRSMGAGSGGPVGWQRDVALAHLNIGWILLRMEQHGDAARELQAAVSQLSPLVDPQRPGSLVDAAGAAALLEQACEKAGLPVLPEIDVASLEALRWPIGAVDSALRRRLAAQLESGGSE